MFFDLIYGDSSGYAAIVTKDENGELTDTKWFHWPEEKTRLEKYVDRRNDEDVYNSVNLFSNTERTKLDNEAVSRVAYADADTCDPSKFLVPPTISVETSSGRWHCYWVLDREVTAEEASLESQRIYLAHAKDGCDAGWAVSKLLRVPGTTNLKRGAPEPVQATYAEANIYSLSTFQSVYSDVTPKESVMHSKDLPEEFTPEQFYDLERRVEAAGLSSLYFEPPAEGQAWHQLLYRLELELFRDGFDAREVFWVAHNAACNKYKRDNREPIELWKEVQKAYDAFVDDEMIDPVPDKGNLPDVRADFLTLEERHFVADNPSFVHEFVAWATSKTDAEVKYFKSLAYMLLTNIFGGRAKTLGSQGASPLNIWVTIAGDTTLTRKSTAVSLYRKMLRRFEEVAALKVPIDVASDVTSEGITTLLGEEGRDGMPAVMVVDEIHGWYSSAKTKNHMANTLERLTDLYDGEVPVVIRATAGKGNKNKNETSFGLLGIGIRDSISNVLTKDDFASGFLARMLWVIGDTPEYNDSMGVTTYVTSDEDEVMKASHDPVRDTIVGRLHRAARKFPVGDKERVVVFSPEAKRRIDQTSGKLMRMAYDSEDRELLLPTTSRLIDSIGKSAAALALYGGRTTVEVEDILHALAQGELWYQDMLRMASAISSSDYEIKLDEVEAFIRSGNRGSRTDAAIRRRFARYRTAEYDDIINSLRKQGRIRYNPEDRKILEAL